HKFNDFANDNTPIRMDLPVPIKAKIVQFTPPDTNFIGNRVMKLELLGYPDDCELIPTSEMTASSISPTVISFEFTEFYHITGLALSVSDGVKFLLQFKTLQNWTFVNFTVFGTDTVTDFAHQLPWFLGLI
uniref:F5/8 type C domain-containing protein n=1 Tax=Macrostomum lignano TaxID=282301 RepID=A0A1I8J1K6_9PLAT